MIPKKYQKMIESLLDKLTGFREITLEEARRLFQEVFQQEIEDTMIRDYLKEKGIWLVEWEGEITEDQDLEIDEILAMDLPEISLDLDTISNLDYRANRYLIKAYQQQGKKEILDQLIVQNRKLVKKIASRHLFGVYRHDLTVEDLEIEGVFGLVKAIDKFQLKQNVEFSTYAIYWIQSSIKQAIVNQGIRVRLPAYLFEQIERVRRMELEQEVLGEPIDAATICELCRLTQEEYDKLKQIEARFLRITSLNEPVNDEDDSNYRMEAIDHRYSLGDVDPLFKDPSEMVEQKFIREELLTSLDLLTDRERFIIECRFGLIHDIPQTLEWIGKKLGVTRERIRQIERRALQKLRKIARSRRLSIAS